MRLEGHIEKWRKSLTFVDKNLKMAILSTNKNLKSPSFFAMRRRLKILENSWCSESSVRWENNNMMSRFHGKITICFHTKCTYFHLTIYIWDKYGTEKNIMMRALYKEKKTWACTYYASFKSPHCDAQIPYFCSAGSFNHFV